MKFREMCCDTGRGCDPADYDDMMMNFRENFDQLLRKNWY
jgi:hypothetical protein